MRIILLQFLWIALSSSVPDQRTIQIMAKTSVLLSEEHSASCIQIFRPENLDQNTARTVYLLWRELAVPEANTTTGIYSFRRYVTRKKGNPWKVTCYKPLKVFLGSNETQAGYVYLTHELRIKDSVWVLFLDTDIHAFLKDANLLFDCQVIVANIRTENLVFFYEVYRVRKDYPLRIIYYGKWTSQKGLDVEKETMHRRRSNLEGIILKTGSIQNWPNTYLKNGKWNGFLIEVWKTVEELTNSSSIHIESDDGKTGLKRPDGTWSGLVGMVRRGDLDVIVSEITLEKTRSHVLDMFHPLIYSSYQLYYKQLGYNLQWDSVFKPFEKCIWFAVIFWILLGSFSISMCYYLSLMFGFETDSEVLSPVYSFFFMLQTLSQQGHHRVPRSAPCRILFFISYMMSAVLMQSYSASLISYLTQQVPYRPFNSLEEMHEHGVYRLLIKDNTAEYGYFKNGKSKLLQDIFKQQVLTVPREHEVINTAQAFQLLCTHPNYVFFGIEIIMKIRLGTVLFPECPIISTTTPISAVYLTMGTIKNGPYSTLFNYHLMRMSLTGVIKRIQNIELPRNNLIRIAGQREVALAEVFQMFVFIGFSVALSFIIFAVERRYWALRSKKRNNANSTLKQNCDVEAFLWPIQNDHMKTSQPLLVHPYDGYFN